MSNVDFKAAEEASDRETWKNELQKLGDKHGFFEELGADHTALFVKSGKTLIVTFENLDHVYEHGSRLPWGFDFVQKQGWSILGLMAHDWTWYRDPPVYALFDRLRDEKFFDQFDQVVFYGASMGAYAACAFSAACPGATVIAISPQATLSRDIAGWEDRYKKAWRRDYSTSYGYAPEMVKSASRVYLFYDPLEKPDAMHAALFQSDNITKLKCRFQGHRIASGLIQMGLLKPTINACVEGSLTSGDFYRSLRARREFRRYLKELIGRIDERRHPLLISLLAVHVLSLGNAPNFRKRMNEANKRLVRRGITPPALKPRKDAA